MEFNRQYLTYVEYKGLGGNAINLMSFNLLEFEVRKKIDLRTQNRLKNETKIPTEVKLCEFKMIEEVVRYSSKIKKINDNNIASENIDGYSVSYLNSSEIQAIMKNKDEELNEIMLEELFGVIVNNEHILYLGVKK